ncbi:MAG: indolepyruvate oxidoreductase subunit beta [Muribaculaceae bacterium]
MKKNIIIAGVGGQGILTIASIIDKAAMLQGLNVKQAEVHGMSQRGGDVQSHLRISSDTIYSDLIPKGKCNLIIAVEPMEALRYIEFLEPNGTIITANEPFKNIPNYPDDALIQKSLKQHNATLVDATEMARLAGNARSSNVAILGAAAKYTGIPKERFIEAISNMFISKGNAIVELNMKAFELGAKLTE